MSLLRSLPVYAFCLLSFCSSSQALVEEINVDRIFFKKVRKLLDRCSLHGKDDLHRLSPACYERTDSNSFYTHIKSYKARAGVEDVWDAYMNIRPEVAWNGNIVSYGFLFSREEDTINYLRDAYNGMRKGQVVFINIGFLGGLFNLAVGNEVQEIDPVKRSIRICYLSNGKSSGSQFIELSETKDGYCRITHTTRYKSESPFRDRKLYPFLHGLIITEFHRNVIALAEKNHREMIALAK